MSAKKFLIASEGEKEKEEVPIICKRCHNFLTLVNVEETKIQLGVGQFKDYYNLYAYG